MSSLAATQADGYYLPPEYYDSGQYQKQTKNQWANSKGHNQFVTSSVVRFELPYKGVCIGANCPQPSMGRGSRYNAKKVATKESYFTTPIWEFQMACRKCHHPWRIRTNPQARGFDYVEGIKIQAGQEDSNELDLRASLVHGGAGGGTVGAKGLDRLESAARGQRKTMTEIEELQQLQQLNAQTTLEDANVNATIRASFRTDRKAKRLRRQHASRMGWREGMELLPATVEDSVAAKSTIYGRPKQTERQRFLQVRKSSIFDAPTTGKGRRKRSRRTLGISAEETMSSPAVVTSSRPTPVQPIASDERRPTTTRAKQKIKLGASIAACAQIATTKSFTSKGVPAGGSLQEMLAAYGSDTDSSAGAD